VFVDRSKQHASELATAAAEAGIPPILPDRRPTSRNASVVGVRGRQWVGLDR
jgi:hypothetical protein